MSLIPADPIYGSLIGQYRRFWENLHLIICGELVLSRRKLIVSFGGERSIHDTNNISDINVAFDSGNELFLIHRIIVASELNTVMFPFVKN